MKYASRKISPGVLSEIIIHKKDFQQQLFICLFFLLVHQAMIIAYVDNDQDDIDFFKAALLLLDKNISFVSFTNGRDALDFLQHTPILPAYLFLDLNMPGMKGKEVLKRLKEHHRLKVIPVIIYSTSVYESQEQELYNLGAFRCIQKPTSLVGLEAAISAILRPL